MKRKLLFRIGKILQRVGKMLARPATKLEDYGLSLWDQNCGCYKCIERRKAKED